MFCCCDFSRVCTELVPRGPSPSILVGSLLWSQAPFRITRMSSMMGPRCVRLPLLTVNHLASFCRSPISSVFPPLPSMTDARAGGWRPSGSTGSVVEDSQVPRGQRSSEASNCRALLGEGGGQNRGRWGSAGQAFSPAQRVKRMQEYRSTRPWWSISGLSTWTVW